MILDNYPVDRHSLLDGLKDLEDRVETARDHIDDVLDVLTGRDEVTGKSLEACTASTESAHRQLDRILADIRKSAMRVKFSNS